MSGVAQTSEVQLGLLQAARHQPGPAFGSSSMKYEEARVVPSGGAGGSGGIGGGGRGGMGGEGGSARPAQWRKYNAMRAALMCFPTHPFQHEGRSCLL